MIARAYLENGLLSHAPELRIIAVLDRHAALAFVPTGYRGLVFQLVCHHDGSLRAQAVLRCTEKRKMSE
jgi:hypothetical protein